MTVQLIGIAGQVQAVVLGDFTQRFVLGAIIR